MYYDRNVPGLQWTCAISASEDTQGHKSSTSLVRINRLPSISALLRHNHSHYKAGLQFDIRAKQTQEANTQRFEDVSKNFVSSPNLSQWYATQAKRQLRRVPDISLPPILIPVSSLFWFFGLIHGRHIHMLSSR